MNPAPPGDATVQTNLFCIKYEFTANPKRWKGGWLGAILESALYFWDKKSLPTLIVAVDTAMAQKVYEVLSSALNR